MRPKLYIFDLDGTLYRGSAAMPFAVEVLAALRKEGAQIRFLTNNSSQTRERLAEKLNSLGFEASVDEVFTSAMGAGKWLQNAGISKVFVVGEEGMVSTLADYSIESVEENPQAVVVGICRSFTYDWMNRALQHLVSGAIFVATNTDSTYPLEGGRIQPGAGAIVASIEKCAGRVANVIGKPQTYMLQTILEDAGIGVDDATVVGDRSDTDMMAAIYMRCRACIVGTGFEVEDPPDGVQFAADLRVLLG